MEKEAEAQANKPGSATTDARVTISAVKVLGCGTFLVAVGYVAMLYLMHGIELLQFDPAQQNASDLLDQYNSYLANIVSIVTPPLGTVLGILVSLWTICFASKQAMAVNTSMPMQLGALVVSFGMNYMLTNGFNSMNVQPVSLPTEIVMSASDLQAAASATAPALTGINAASGNVDTMPLEDTVIHSLLYPPEKIATQCKGGMGMSSDLREMGAGVTFGFPTTAWQERLLPNGQAPSKALEISLNASAANQHAMPMSLKTASSLMAHMMLFADELLTDNMFNMMGNALQNTSQWRNDTDATIPTHWTTFSDVVYYDGVSVDSDANQAAFVATSASLLRDAFAGSTVHSVEKGTAKWTRNDLLNGVVFEAMTLDVPMIPELFKHGTNAQIRKTVSDSYAAQFNLPESSMIVVANEYCTTVGCALNTYELEKAKGQFAFDSVFVYPDPIIHAIAECQDPDVGIGFMAGGKFTMRCNGNAKSNTSMLVVSLAKRIHGDAMYYHNVSVPGGTGLVEFVNMRKYYTVLVGRLSWTTSDRAASEYALCSNTLSSCHGLLAPLVTSNDSTVRQVLLTGDSALPVERLHVYNYAQDSSKTIWTPLVTWNMQFPNAHTMQWSTRLEFFVDVIMPQQFKETNFTPTVSYSPSQDKLMCSDSKDLQMKHITQNRLYMEHPLQPSYTAALYFLLQNGVVRNVIPLNETTTTLQFDGNYRLVGVRASIPATNATITLTGCVLAAAVCVIIVALSSWFSARMEREVTPHRVAQMLLDDSSFPSDGMECKVRVSNGELQGLDTLSVESIVLCDDDSLEVCLMPETLAHARKPVVAIPHFE